ncbi:MAG: ATP-binding cassette domain-containing protein [Asgard group archaeon]
MKMIDVEGIVKRFKDIVALKNVSFSIDEGEIFGILGPNGAGKTTLIRILSGLMKPDEGKAIIDGNDVRKNPGKVQEVVGVVSEGVDVYEYLTARENLFFWGSMFNISKTQIEKKTDELLEFFDLKEHQHRLAGKFSTGMRRKLSIAASLIHDPKILFFDEVTLGLDPHTAIKIRETAKFLSEKENKTVIWTSHYLFEPEVLCDRLAILLEGKIANIGTPKQIREKARKNDFWIIEIPRPSKNEEKLEKIAKDFNATVVSEPSKYTIKVNEKSANKLAKELLNSGFNIVRMNPLLPTLEEAFISITAKYGG